MSNYYVYVLSDPETGVPFYVGKGTGRRAWRHETDVRLHGAHWNPMVLSEIKRIHKNGDSVKVDFISSNLLHEEAKVLEIETIAKIGRRNQNTGPLANLTDGGEGTVGRIFNHSEKTKEQIRKSMTGKTNSEESNAKRRKSMTGRYVGRVMSEDWCAKIGKSCKGQERSPEFKKHLSVIRTGENNPAAKTWILENPNGEVVTIKSLSTFCRNNDLSYRKIRSGSGDKGWKLKLGE